MRAVVLIVAVLLCAVAFASAEEFFGLSLDKCSICRKGCGLFKREQDKQRCGTVCDFTLCKNKPAETAEPAETNTDEEVASDSEFKINKCKICKAGCQFLKEADQSKCSGLCDAIFCNDESTPAPAPAAEEEASTSADAEAFATEPDVESAKAVDDDTVYSDDQMAPMSEVVEAESDSEFKIKLNKCKICKAGCEFFKSDSDKSKCQALCDAVLCN